MILTKCIQLASTTFVSEITKERSSARVLHRISLKHLMKSDLSPSKISRTSFGKSILLNDHPDLNVIRKAFYLAETG